MAKIRTEIEVSNAICDWCRMCKLYPRSNDPFCDGGAYCNLFNIPLAFSPRYLGYVRCEKCKQAEIKNEN